MNQPCILCGCEHANPLPNPSSARAIASDLRILDEALDKFACSQCGFIYRPQRANVNFEDSSYQLYDHAPGFDVEVLRQSNYARWLLANLSDVQTIFEAGAGNGSLLAAMQSIEVGLVARGVEPAPGAAARARGAGINVDTGVLAARAGGHPSDCAIAVNVIEHVDDPLMFLRTLATHGVRIAVCCPNGLLPNTEILFADHRWSFTPDEMRRLFSLAGLRVELQQPAPASIGDFFLTIGRADSSAATPVVPRAWTVHALYLETWGRLDSELSHRSGTGDIVCFGAGEAAALLRAYAPITWARVTRCVTDRPNISTFGALPVRDYSSAQIHDTILLGVHPRAQDSVLQRLTRDGSRVISWNDIITA